MRNGRAPRSTAPPDAIRVTGLFVYPVKSCAGTALETAELGARGIRHDREFMLVNPLGQFLTQRQLPRMALIHPTRTAGTLELTAQGMPALRLAPRTEGDRTTVTVWRDQVGAIDQGDEVADWLSTYLETPSRLVRQADDAVRPVSAEFARLPTDEVSFADGYPLLLISEESLADLNARLHVPLPVNRFRPNIVVRGAGTPYAEDSWSEVSIGGLRCDLVKACARCAITTTNQLTAERATEPLATLATYRRDPRGVLFGQNVIHHTQGCLQVGDAVQVEHRQPPQEKTALYPPVTLPTPQHTAEIERLHAISVEIAGLQELSHVMDRALDYCLELTASEFGFVGLMQGSDQMDVAAIKGFVPDDESFYAGFRSIPVRPSVFGVVVLTGEPHLSNDVAHDALHVGTPRGHPPVRTFLGAPLVFGSEVLGMLGVANRKGGYDRQQERLLSVFANQVAVAIRNARLYEEQRGMIARLQRLSGQLEAAERDRLLDDERQRIARELHDRVAQTFFSIGLAVQSVLEGDGANGDPRQQRTMLESIRGLSALGNEHMREAIFALSRADVQERGLVRTLWTVVRDFRERTGLEADLVLVGKERPLPPETAGALLGVVREALANVEQHAHATSVVVTLRTFPGGVALAVQDDGLGAPTLLLRSVGSSFTHFGLRGLQERIRKLGGAFTARNGEDGGLVVRVRVPVSDAPAAAPEPV